MKTQKTTTKQVTVLAVYKFNKVARICFETLSSNGNDHYHTCFQGNGRESCSCPSTSKKGCYHRDGLRERAQAYFESQKQQVSTPAATTDETHHVSRVDGLVTRWYPEYRQGSEWFRYPEPDGNRAVFFVIEGRAEAWLAERLAAVAEQAAEAKMDAFKAAMDEQYASDPRRGLSQGEMEAAQSYMRHYDDRY